MSPFYFYLLLGGALLATELVVFQFTTFWLFFVGIGALVAALYAWVFGGGFMAATAVFVVASAAVTALLYSPIRRWQRQPGAMAESDAVGKRVVVSETIPANGAGAVVWSGTTWPAELVDSTVEVSAGDRVRVVKVEGIRLLVEPL